RVAENRAMNDLFIVHVAPEVSTIGGPVAEKDGLVMRVVVAFTGDTFFHGVVSVHLHSGRRKHRIEERLLTTKLRVVVIAGEMFSIDQDLDAVLPSNRSHFYSVARQQGDGNQPSRQN